VLLAVDERLGGVGLEQLVRLRLIVADATRRMIVSQCSME
jgi:hypothetical protein